MWHLQATNLYQMPAALGTTHPHLKMQYVTQRWLDTTDEGEYR